MLRSAIALAVVIGAIFNRAIDALDVLVAASVLTAIVHLDDHPFDIGKDQRQIKYLTKKFSFESSAFRRHLYYTHFSA